MCRLHLDRIKIFDNAVADLDARIAPLAGRHARAADLLETLPGFGDVIVAGWLGAIGPAPHQHFATASRLASWATLCPGNYMSAKKSKGGRTGNGGAYIKPLLIQAAWAAVRVPAGCRPGSAGWSASSAAPATRARRSGRSPRSPTPCSRSPTAS